MKTISICLALLLVCHFAVAQSDVLKYLPAAAVPTGGQANLQNLLNGYLTPIAEDFGMIVNNGWFNTPVAHKRWGFDINLTVTTVSVSSSAQTFDLPPVTGISYVGSGPLPTAYGEESVFPRFNYNAGPNTGLSFEGPDGAGVTEDLPVGSLAIPTLQMGVGVLEGTDLRVRYSPTLDFNGVEVGNWGIGVLHDFRRLIPSFVEKEVSLSVFAGYTRMTATTDLSGVYAGTGQEGIASGTGITAQVLIGKEFKKFLTLYAGGGYNRATTDYEINGTYAVNTTGDGTSLNSPVSLTNPYNNEFSKSSFRFTSGFRLRAGPVTLNADYTLLSARSLLTAGFGFVVKGKE